MTTLFDDQPELVSGFQVIQNEDFSIDVNCILNTSVNIEDAFFLKVKEILNKKCNYDVAVRINSVSELIHDRGKLKFIINKCNGSRN